MSGVASGRSILEQTDTRLLVLVLALVLCWTRGRRNRHARNQGYVSRPSRVLRQETTLE